MIASYIDVVDSEEDRVEACTALVSCFKSMIDLSSRIMANAVLSRRKIFLKNVDFSSKATSSKLLNLPLTGPQLFGGKYFDVLHSSAENIRDAKETQNVYRSSFNPSKHRSDQGSKKRSHEQESLSDKNVKHPRFEKGESHEFRGDSGSNFRPNAGKPTAGKGPFLWKNFSHKTNKK